MRMQSTPSSAVARSPEPHTASDAFAIATLVILALLATLLPGCTLGPDEPVRDAREALGTIVTVTAYGDDEAAVLTAVDDAYAAMAAVEIALNVYDAEPATTPSSTAAELNTSPAEWTLLPGEAETVLVRTQTLDVADEYSSTLYGVQSLYEFEKGGRVPSARELITAIGAASGFETREGDQGLEARFAPVAGLDASAIPVGVDFGGAAKGLGLDRAVSVLRASGSIDAAIISAGSTTIAIGEKPDGAPWKIGIEDPRDPENMASVVESMGDIIVSTSGDYQRYFEADGIRYHHILDPESGIPAEGTRSLTVVGTESGLDSDILSTALFVMGPERAKVYAEREGLGLYVIDDEGQALVTPGPETSYSFEGVE